MRGASLIGSRPGLAALAALALAAAALLAACTSGDDGPPALTRAEVAEIVRAELPDAPPPSEPGLSRSEVEEIVRAVLAALPQPAPVPGLTRADVDAIVRAALEEAAAAESPLTRAEVAEIVGAALDEAAAAAAPLTRAEVAEIVRAALEEAAAAESPLTPADVRRIARNEVASIPPRSAPADYTRFFVRNAISRYEAEGLDATLAHYSREESIDGQWYLFIIDAEGEVIAHYNPQLIGENLNGPVGTDANGYNFGPEMLAASGEGKWVSYVYHNPERGLGSGDFDELELKNVWVRRHDGLLFASGWYIDAEAFTQDLVAAAVERFRAEGLAGTVAYFAAPGSALAGLESTIAYYNSTETADGRWSAFIADDDGVFVAHSDPAMIGGDVRELFGPEPLEVSPEGNWVSTESMRIWIRSHDGYLFGSGWHPRQARP